MIYRASATFRGAAFKKNKWKRGQCPHVGGGVNPNSFFSPNLPGPQNNRKWTNTNKCHLKFNNSSMNNAMTIRWVCKGVLCLSCSSLEHLAELIECNARLPIVSLSCSHCTALMVLHQSVGRGVGGGLKRWIPNYPPPPLRPIRALQIIALLRSRLLRSVRHKESC